MQLDHLYAGSALALIDERGRVRLPRFVRETLGRRSEAGFVVLGPHESDACLTGYDPAFRRMLFADSERRRLHEEAGGAGPERHHGRARRVFGRTEQARIDSAGRIALPPMLRGIGRIEDVALFVGTGGAFEIWNPRLAIESGDPALAELAGWRLGHDRPERHEKEE